MSGFTSVSAVGVPGRFQTYDGQVIGPDGAVFRDRGINVSASQMGDANQILADFPGLNFIRLNVFNYASPDAYAAFISTMTAHHVVVELEDHTSSDGADTGGGTGAVFTGTQLSNELNWYSSIAKAYVSNPYVWFGTDNEPATGALSPWQQQTYDAIRNTGNNNPIILELPGGAWPDGQTVTSYGMDPAVYAQMSNIIGDVHLYGWSSHYIPTQTAVDSALADMVRGVQTIPTLDGAIPVILGEYGPATDGATPDANADQVLHAAQQATQTAGATAFGWSEGGADTLTDEQGNLTPYGQEVAQWMASSATPSAAVASTQSGDTVSPAAVSAAVTMAAGPSFISGSNGAGNPVSGTNSAGGYVYRLPAAGTGVLAFTGDVLDTNATLDLAPALAATDWNGASSSLKDYLVVTDSPNGATISIATTSGGPGTAIATIPGATNMDFNALLAHSWT